MNANFVIIVFYFNSACYINHYVPGLFEPNCKYVVEKRKIFIYASQNIVPGTELFLSYGDNYFKNYKPLEKEEAEKKFKDCLNKQQLNMNLRYSSSNLPAVRKWVEFAKEVIVIKRKRKNQPKEKKI